MTRHTMGMTERDRTPRTHTQTVGSAALWQPKSAQIFQTLRALAKRLGSFSWHANSQVAQWR